MGVTRAKELLESAAREFTTSGNAAKLFKAAITYARAKAKARTRRDRWKERKRL